MSDVLERGLTPILEADIDPAGDLLVRLVGKANAAGLGQLLQAGRNVDRIPDRDRWSAVGENIA